MKRTFLSAAGAALCLVLSGCGGNGTDAGGGQMAALQMEPDGENAMAESVQRDIQPGGIFDGTDTVLDSAELSRPAVNPAASGDPGRDLEEIKSYLSGYPDTLQELEKAECYVILHGREHSGREYLDDFLENVDEGNPGELTIVQFTVEGDPIFLYLNTDAENVYAVEDISRDKMGGNGEKFFEKTFDSVWLVREKDSDSYYVSLYAQQEQDMIVTVFTAAVERPDTDEGEYSLPPWAKPPAP